MPLVYDIISARRPSLHAKSLCLPSLPSRPRRCGSRFQARPCGQREGLPFIMKIRKATQEDIPFLLEQAKELASSLATDSLFFPDQLLAEFYIGSLVREHIAFVAEDDGKLIGMIAGEIKDHHFRPDIKMVSEWFWWVLPEYRGNSAGGQLVKSLLGEAKNQGCQIAQICTIPGSEVTDSVMEQHGFRLVEKTFVKEL